MCISGQWVLCTLASCNQPHPGGGFQSSGHSGAQVGQNPVEIDFQNSGETTTPEIIFSNAKNISVYLGKEQIHIPLFHCHPGNGPLAFLLGFME